MGYPFIALIILLLNRRKPKRPVVFPSSWHNVTDEKAGTIIGIVGAGGQHRAPQRPHPRSPPPAECRPTRGPRRLPSSATPAVAGRQPIREALADDLDAPAALAAVDRWAARQTDQGGTDTGAPGVVSRAVDALLGVAL